MRAMVQPSMAARPVPLFRVTGGFVVYSLPFCAGNLTKAHSTRKDSKPMAAALLGDLVDAG